jgi:hypothetical protein
METIGQRLRKKRLEKKLDLDDVYKITKIHPRVLKALEEDRAEENLSQIYIKNFIYDYAKFLGMDAQQLVKEYLDLHPVSSSSLSISNKKIRINFDFKHLRLNIFLILVSVVFLGGVFFIFRNRAVPLKGKEIGEKGKRIEIRSAETIGFPKIQKKDQLNLVLKAKKKVWIQVKSDGKIVFEDVLKKGDIERWLADDSIELWVGDGSALELELNGRHLGSLGTGIIKNIIITRQGMEIGGK